MGDSVKLLQRDGSISGGAAAGAGAAIGGRLLRIAIADDHPITRHALKAFLEDEADFRVVAEASSGREAIDLVRRHPLDILLLDLDMPGQSGIDALPMIKAKAAHVGVIVLSGYPQQQYAVPVIRNGASGYLSKDCTPQEIVAAIRKVASGSRYITPAVAELLATQVVAAPMRGLHEHLSARELQVFIKLAQGLSPGQVADDLCLSSKTVSTYRSRVMTKLQARSNSDLTYYALKHHLLD
jgi:two-component system, NarL family, invasion response regulator UvrY